MSGPSKSSQPTIRRRRVFYIPGYDPIHPRRYRELYRSESVKQADILGYEITQSPKTGSGPYGWHVTAEIDGTKTETDIDVLVWSDIVRQSMTTTIIGTYLQLIRTAWAYIATGTLFRLMRLRKGPIIAALYPIGMLLLQLMIAVLIFWGVSRLSTRLIGWGIGGFPGLSGAIGLALGTIAAIYVLRWFKARDNKFFAYYLMHDYAYSARSRGANPPELETRITEFRTQIAAALSEPYDEVLVVGHSSGAHLAVSILSDLLRAGAHGPDAPALSFLSLGQVVPMVSFLPDAYRLRADLAYLSATRDLTWIDVTAPGDGCAFALCDPAGVTGVAPEEQTGPLILSAAFTQTLSPELWKSLRWRFFRLHFQYLCAFDRPGDYDYFQITAGPKTLGQRFAGRSPSKSRINTPASRYTSTTAP